MILSDSQDGWVRQAVPDARHGITAEDSGEEHRARPFNELADPKRPKGGRH